MIVSVASGKGGTGKTTVTASLISMWESPVVAVDLDVEEPNLHLFLHPDLPRSREEYMEVPVVDEDRCTACGQCSAICQFKAITVMAGHCLVFPEMCHGCGGCLAVCPEDALSRGGRVLGTLDEGSAATPWGKADFIMGRLRVGEAMSPPLMKRAKARLREIMAERTADAPAETSTDAVIDAPPGVSCPAMAAVMDTDIILLVTEPTPFGFHDFKLAVEAFESMDVPMAAVINRAGLGDRSVYDFCAEKGLPVLAEIPYDRAVAEAYARGRVIADVSPAMRDIFIGLRDGLRSLAAGKEATHA